MKSTKAIFNQLFTKKDSACQAPFSSMRFNHSGNVLACCFNRGNILGKFPEQSIHDIWFGENIKQLRKALDKNDFSLGCQYCEKEIICGNREASGAAQYDYLKKWKLEKLFPTMLDFELGSTCNFECIMCSGEYSTSIRKNREKKSAYYSPYDEHAALFVEQLTPFIPHLKEMRFVGGEPFLMKVHYEIWDKVLEINPNVILNVLTNGSILNKRVQKMLEKGNFKISVSIDSIVKETFEAIRINGDFDQVMGNVAVFQALMRERGHVMNFNLCVMRQNWTEIPEYFEYCNKNNIKIVLHTVEFPIHCSLWNLSSSELEEIEKVYENAVFIEHSSTSDDNKETFTGLYRQIKNWRQAALSRENNRIKTVESPEQVLYERTKKENLNQKINTFEDNWGLLKSVLNQFSDDDRNKIIDFLNELEIYLLVSELNVSSEERLYERFKIIADN